MTPKKKTVVAKKSKVGTQSKTTKVVKKTTQRKVALPAEKTNAVSEEELEYDTEVDEIEQNDQGAVGPDPTKEIEDLRRRLLELETDDS